MIIGRQTTTETRKFLDLLAIDANARLVVIENKRDETAPEVVAQTLDYAAWVRTLDYDELNRVFVDYHLSRGEHEDDLAEAFDARFGEPLEEIRSTPRMVIFAERLDGRTERAVEFLHECPSEADRLGFG